LWGCTALRRGDRVVAPARKPDQLDDLAREYDERIVTLALDVTDSAAAKDAVHATISAFGSIDVVVKEVSRSADFPEGE
jgi:NADP-dependent 3-hydroxy acid dehydrogenase YdfG